MKKVLIGLLLACAPFCGCRKEDDLSPPDVSTDPPPREYVLARNQIRRERSVPEIQSNWTFIRRSGDCERWEHNAERWEHNSSHFKNVYFQRDLNCIVMESDRYSSGRLFPAPDTDAGTIDEFLVVYYFYGAERFTVGIVTDNKAAEQMVEGLSNKMQFPGFFGGLNQMGYFGSTNQETLAVADKILTTWGMNRL